MVIPQTCRTLTFFFTEEEIQKQALIMMIEEANRMEEEIEKEGMENKTEECDAEKIKDFISENHDAIFKRLRENVQNDKTKELLKKAKYSKTMKINECYTIEKKKEKSNETKPDEKKPIKRGQRKGNKEKKKTTPKGTDEEVIIVEESEPIEREVEVLEVEITAEEKKPKPPAESKRKRGRPRKQKEK